MTGHRQANRWLLTLVGLFIIPLGSVAQELPYGVATWPEAGRGNHRAVVRVARPSEAVWVHIPWRRRDPHPEQKAIVVIDATTGKQITNVVAPVVTREAGDVVFQPETVPGDYEVYYLPYTPPGGGPFGTGGEYLAVEDTADPAWRDRHHLDAAGITQEQWRELPRAQALRIEARGEFHRMDPMEVIATAEETSRLLARYPDRQYLLFPEDRRHPIRMFEDLPYRWVQRGPQELFTGQARPGEFYVLQVGVWACRAPIEGLQLTAGELKSADGATIGADAIRCINLEGRDWLGSKLKKTFTVGRGIVRPLWIGVRVPEDALGVYTGAIRLATQQAPESVVRLELQVQGDVLQDGGDSDLWRLSRLRWLDSSLGLEDGVVPPFVPVSMQGSTLKLLGRQISFGPLGLPAQVTSGQQDILARPVRLAVSTPDGAVQFGPGTDGPVEQRSATVRRECKSRAGDLALTVSSLTEFDGCISYEAVLSTASAVSIEDIALEVPLRRDVTTYMMGMGKRGGYRPDKWAWKWDIEHADNMVWLGDAHAGLQVKLCGPTDPWQMRDLRPTGIPVSWGNEGKGGCLISERGDTVTLKAYTGSRTLSAGDSLQFRFRFLITPFKPLDPGHYNWRYGDVRADANILHVHHGTSENPYINYPFLTAEKLGATVAQVKSITSRQTDFGSLAYPAVGNINPDRGCLHVWTQIRFDPLEGQPRQAVYNQQLFSLDFPNQNQLGLYWNIDDRGMRTYVRHGAPSHNQYPVLIGTHSPQWRKGQRHRVTLSWGDRLEVFVDGRRMGGTNFSGTLRDGLEGALLNFRGDGFAIDAIRVESEPYVEGRPVEPQMGDTTLLLDTFSAWDGGPTTRPLKAAKGASGAFAGVADKAQGEYGPQVQFSFRTAPAPPKGVNVYYTVRELSNHVAEMWALRSLGSEVFRTGGHSIYEDPPSAVQLPVGHPWLREHLVGGYETAWRQVLPDGDMDAAIATQGLSRWHNYYVEGLNWLMRSTGVDGLYLDGIGYDRQIMKRVARVMHDVDPASRINFHSGDGFSPPWDKNRGVSPANQYMEHFPYISNLWFGELFDYSRSPDYWLVEISGIPFGLTGEMLNYENGGNAYRGMIYGMTGRQHPSKSAMWRFWDEFGIRDAEMVGYWKPDCPVRTGRKDVLATVYRKQDATLIALARWPEDRPRPAATAPAAAALPTVDGHLAPGEWDRAAALTGFTVFGGSARAQNQTRAFVTFDAANLYVAFRCEQPGGRLKTDATRRDGDVWEDDAVEVFIQPNESEDSCVQFVGNSRGVLADNRDLDTAWDGDWTYRASTHEGRWEGELSIPFASLGMTPPSDGQSIGLNVCRDQQTPTKQLSCWSPAQLTFHDVSTFGRLNFTSQATRQDAKSAQEATVLPTTTKVRLRIDWEALGARPEGMRLVAPAIEHFQSPAQFAPTDEIPIEPDGGWLLILQRR